MTVGIDFTEEQIMNHLRLRISRSQALVEKITELKTALEHERNELAYWTDKYEAMREEKNGRT